MAHLGETGQVVLSSEMSDSAISLNDAINVLRAHGLLDRVQRIDATATRTSIELKPLRVDAKGRETEDPSSEPEKLSPRDLMRKHLPGAVIP
jgi:hypothetical protein